MKMTAPGFAACLVLAYTGSAAAQPAETLPATAALMQAAPAEKPQDPWASRPVCDSMFLKSEWRLTAKQKACNWIDNGVLSTSRVFTTGVSTIVTMIVDNPSERGDGFRVRYGRKWAQGAVATTGEYIGALIGHEDPRSAPPYLVLRPDPPPSRFFVRLGHAIARNVVTTTCVAPCLSEKDIRNRPGVSRVLGAIASGAGGVAFNWNEPDRATRMWRGVATAYGTSLGHELVTEFKPELTALGGRLFRMFGGH
jgi:hypothetical protein